jgi:hypothetical protein
MRSIAFLHCGRVWDATSVETELLVQADRLVGGSDAVLVIDDTAIPKKGTHSVGVAAQYASALGKTANCPTLVSLTFARGEVPVMLALRLFLHQGTMDLRAGSPAAERRTRSRSLRGPILARPASSCAHDDDRLRFPPVSPAQNSKAKKRINGPPPQPTLPAVLQGHRRTHRSATTATMPALQKMDLQRKAACSQTRRSRCNTGARGCLQSPLRALLLLKSEVYARAGPGNDTQIGCYDASVNSDAGSRELPIDPS